ncbi:MAG: nitronate monooxygenase, partial [Halanaerobiales bacterium]
VDAVKIPVIAAGGIADGRGFLAALALGAEGIQMGTRFVASRECTAHVAYKEAIIKAGDRDAVVTGRSTGHPVRNLKNTLTRTLDEMEKKGVNKEEIEKLAAGSLRKAAIDGDIENGSVMAGQIAALIKEIKPVGEIIEEIVREAEELLQKLQEGLVR